MRYAILALAVLALAACGGKKSSSSTASNATPAEAVANAAQATVAKGGEHVSVTATVSLNGQKLSLDGSGDFRSNPALGHMSLAIKGSGLNTSFDEVVSGQMWYLKSSLLGSQLPSGKTWVSLDLAKTTKAFGVDLSTFTQGTPTTTLSYLAKATKVTRVGDGHYRATVKASLAGSPAIPLDIWVDGNGLIQRVTSNVNGSKIETVFSNYGEKVSVKVPSASETVDISKLGG